MLSSSEGPNFRALEASQHVIGLGSMTCSNTYMSSNTGSQGEEKTIERPSMGDFAGLHDNLTLGYDRHAHSLEALAHLEQEFSCELFSRDRQERSRLEKQYCGPLQATEQNNLTGSFWNQHKLSQYVSSKRLLRTNRSEYWTGSPSPVRWSWQS